VNRNTRMLLVVGIAVVTATLASVGVYMAIRNRPVLTREVPQAYVVVAAKPLEQGVRLTSDLVKRIGWPERNPVAGSFSSIDQILNRGVVAPLLENEPITESKLAPLEAGTGLPPSIRSGMRAMSVKVNEVIGVAGFVVPGTKVDVLVTIHEDRGSVSRVVVSNVQVLAAGTRYDEAAARKEGKPIPSSVVTLMVSPVDAERIALALTEGQIMLALRNPLDTEATRTPGIRTAGLMQTGLMPAESVAPIAAPRPPARPAQRVAAVDPVRPPVSTPPTVETIKAGKRAQESLR
jgi:pilus assembly protein CpaB